MADFCPVIQLCTKSPQKKNTLFIRFIPITYIEILQAIFHCAIKRQHLLSNWLKILFVIHFICNRFCFHVTSLPQSCDIYKRGKRAQHLHYVTSQSNLKYTIAVSVATWFQLPYILRKSSVISQKIHLKNSVVGFDSESVTQLYLLLTTDP